MSILRWRLACHQVNSGLDIEPFGVVNIKVKHIVSADEIARRSVGAENLKFQRPDSNHTR